MRLKSKVFAGVISIFLLVGMLGYVGYESTQSVAGEFYSLSRENIQVINALKDIEMYSVLFDEKTNEYIISSGVMTPEEKSDELASIGRARKGFQESLALYRSLVEAYFPDELEALQSIENSSLLFLEHYDEKLSMKLSNATLGEIATLKNKYGDSDDILSEILEQALAHENAEIDELNSKGSVGVLAYEDVFGFENEICAAIFGDVAMDESAVERAERARHRFYHFHINRNLAERGSGCRHLHEGPRNGASGSGQVHDEGFGRQPLFPRRDLKRVFLSRLGHDVGELDGG